ncbi:MAG TPA: cation diffusion facilitator family transporter [Methylobacter sp.]|jgi:cation diffusion facilitator family transporter
MSGNSSSKKVVYAALIGNLMIAITKAGAAAWTGSSAMLSEAIHSFVDIGNEILLLYGMRRSTRPADPEHPLGYGRELYFWSFIVALLVFALGAGVSIYEGVLHLQHPQPISDPLVSFVVLALSFLYEGASWWVAFRQFRAVKGTLGYYEAFRRSKDPVSFMVLFEDSAALIGILIAAIGTFAATSLDEPIFDGVASIFIGLVLAGTAILLARESKSLLIGERAERKLIDSIQRIANKASMVSRTNEVLTVHLAPDQILAALSLEFSDDLRTPQIEEIVINIERDIRAAHPEIVTLFVKPQTAVAFRKTVGL